MSFEERWRPFQGTKRFEVERRLGQGSFGVVYQAFDRERKERVALKTLSCLDAETIYRFKREFRLLADVSSPHLVSLGELFSDGDVWFFTMDLVEGEDFLSYVRGDRGAGFDQKRLRWALSELSRGVYALHETGRLHRDIKPSNVLVTGEGQVVLLDFGLVTWADTRRSTDDVLGTVAYMAPEQAMGRDLTAAADWYAVGVMLYEALTGRLPHQGNEVQVLLAKQRETPPSPAELVSEVPAELSELTMRLLGRAPKQRAGAAEVRQALGGVEGLEGVQRPRPPSLSCAESPDELALVGRHREQSELWRAFRAVERGRPVVVEVTGRSGMGKTALLQSFLARVRRQRGVVVLTGRCHEQEMVPFKAVDSVIDDLCRHLRQLELAKVNALMPRDVRALARLFPVLERVESVRGAPEVSASLQSQEVRQRAFGALAELLGRIADREPLVVVIDDLQWGDLDSAMLLERLLAEADPPGMLLVLSYRSEERDRSVFLQRVLEAPAVRAASQTVEVGALNEAAALELVRMLLQDHGDEARCAAIVVEAGRNPLFLSTLARRAGAAEGGEVSFEQVLAAIVAGVSAEARRLLEVVAVSGQPLALREALVATNLEAGGSRPLAELRAARLLRSCGGEAEQIECYHDRVREAVVAGLDPARRRHHHRGLAEAFLSLGIDDPERLTLYFEGAGELERAAEEAERAAALASEKLAFDRAAQLYRTARQHRRLGTAKERKIRIKLADALANAGRGAEAAAEYLAAAEARPRLEALELRRRAALQLLGCGRVDRGVEVMREVLDELGMRLAPGTHQALASALLQRARLRLRGRRFRPVDEPLLPPGDLLQIDTCWTAVQGFRMTDATHALTFAARFLQLALELGEPYRVSLGLSLEATTLAALGITPSIRRRTAEVLEEGSALAHRIGSQQAIAFNHFSGGVVASFFGRWREALVQCDRAIEIFEERCTGVALELAQSHLFALNALYYLGDFREISRRTPLLIQTARARGDLFSSVGLLGGKGFLAWLARGEAATAQRELLAARRQWPGGVSVLQTWLLDSAEAMNALAMGRGLVAWRWIEQAVVHFRRTPYWRSAWLRCEAEFTLGSAAVAAALETSPGSSFRRDLIDRVSRSVRALEQQRFPTARPFSLVLWASLATIDGQPEAAEGALAEASSAFEAADMALHAAIARRCLGRVVGGARGERLLETADQVLAELGGADPQLLSSMLAPGLDAAQLGP